jgi:hypothetical protein
MFALFTSTAAALHATPLSARSWWSHLHASSLGSTWEELLEAPSPEELARALEVLTKERAAQQGVETGAGVRYEAARGGRDGEFGAGALGAAREEESPGGRGGGDPCHSTTGDGGDNGAITSGKNTASGSGSVVGADGAASSPGPCGGGPLDIVSHAAWRQRLQSLLDAHPGAIVGEVGVDRAAVIPGTRARVRFDHQLALLAEQLALAAELGRPASVHCVRGYGHLLSLFAGLPGPGACPPAVMLHSYGGSPEEVGRFTRLKGIGGRFYFSFSAAINARTPEKLAARIRAVPDDRLLLESDQVGAQKTLHLDGAAIPRSACRRLPVCYLAVACIVNAPVLLPLRGRQGEGDQRLARLGALPMRVRAWGTCADPAHAHDPAPPGDASAD